ncbi:MAG TPA: hypothetical protein VGK94_07870 [Candidatus Polarisedimenticolia bacterium]
MSCHVIDLPGGGRMITCGPGVRRRPCSVERCLSRSDVLCDWPVGKGRSCSAPLCRDHSYRVGASIDYCAQHWKAREARAGR